MARETDHERPIVDAALALAARHGWRGITLQAVAHEARLPLATVAANYRSRAQILAAFTHRVDRAMLAGIAADSLAEPTRERLFDLIMRRLDTLAPHKEGVRAILRELPRDPLAALCAGGTLLRSMAATLEGAGISAAGIGGLVRTKALAAIYLDSLRVWLSDDSADKAHTMAHLDKQLKRAESLAARLCPGPNKHRARAPSPSQPSPTSKTSKPKRSPRRRRSGG